MLRADDVHRLLLFDEVLAPKVQQLHTPSQSVHQVDQEVPWQVTWLVSNYIKKHIFVDGRKPDFSRMQPAFTKFPRSVAWQW